MSKNSQECSLLDILIDELIKIFNYLFDCDIITKDKLQRQQNDENYQIKIFNLAIFTICQISAFLDKLSVKLLIQANFLITDIFNNKVELIKWLKKNKISDKLLFYCEYKSKQKGKTSKLYINSIGKKNSWLLK